MCAPPPPARPFPSNVSHSGPVPQQPQRGASASTVYHALTPAAPPCRGRENEHCSRVGTSTREQEIGTRPCRLRGARALLSAAAQSMVQPAHYLDGLALTGQLPTCGSGSGAGSAHASGSIGSRWPHTSTSCCARRAERCARTRRYDAAVQGGGGAARGGLDRDAHVRQAHHLGHQPLHAVGAARVAADACGQRGAAAARDGGAAGPRAARGAAAHGALVRAGRWA